jgi:prevent-host-death family protein
VAETLNRQTQESVTVAISLVEDIKTVEDLEAAPRALLEQARATKRPVVIAETGKPSVVMLTAERYEWLVHLVNFSRLMNEAEESIRKEGTRPAEEVFKELLEKGKVRPRKQSTRRRRA